MPSRSTGWGWQKPPAGTPVDWSHPLANGLVALYVLNEGGGRPTDALGLWPTTVTIGTAPTWAPGQYGTELQLNNVAGGYFTAIGATPVLNYPYTLGTVAMVPSAGNNGSLRDLVGVWNNAGNSRDSIGFGSTTAATKALNGASNLANGPNVPIGTYAALAATFPNTSSKATLYVNGISRAQTTSVLASPTPSKLGVLGNATASFLSMTLGVVWNYVLTNDEIAFWADAPFDLLAPPRRRRHFAVSAAPTSHFPYPLFQAAANAGRC
jgi:hypothetical protein